MAEQKYIEAIGRRKSSTARVRITPAAGMRFIVNDKSFEEYFPTKEAQAKLLAPFEKSEIKQKFHVTALVSGGGVNSQSEAVRHGIARALTEHDSILRQPLKKSGLLKRDPRKKERRKYGLKKARKAPQWSKR